MRATTVILAPLAALLLSGCFGTSGSGRRGTEAVDSKALEQLRNAAKDAAADTKLPMARRVAAFEALRKSFSPGTPEEVVIRYLDPETRTRLREGYDGFVLLVVGPDGRERWLTIIGGKLSDDPQKEK